jgi:hypothetical protein|tara:strand:- start:1113 stop:1961 length:849 start_codon:yes stop_codon:yes gene_type:complete
MAKNSFFKHTSNEQQVVEDLTIESIQIHGQDMVYIPRTLVNKDDLFGEDSISKFESGTEIEMYIESVDGFEGDGDFISKFGLEIKDSMSLVVSKKRFEQELAMTRPLEGDLIYFPLTNGLFEIKFVEHENPFYQLGKLYTYKLSCELFQYSQEDIETGWSDIDTVESDNQATAINLTLTANTGTFLVGEPLTSGTWSANVVSWAPTTKIIGVHGVVGSITASDTITGADSGATGTMGATQDNTTNIIPNTSTDPFDDSDDIQREADDVFDFTDIDPFSEGGY